MYEKQAGILSRKKFRIRIYNFKDDVIKLEIKSRNGQFITKESSSLTLNQYNAIRNGDYNFLGESRDPVFNEFYYQITNNRLMPDVIVDYVREAYISDINNIRITFDKNLRTGLADTSLFDPSLVTVDVIEKPLHVLEIKYDNFLPSHLMNILQIASNQRYAISKFVVCKKYNKLNNWEDN